MYLELNNLLKILQVQLSRPLHPKRKVLLYTQYLSSIVATNTPELLYPFFADCIEEYLSSLKLYTPYFSPPEITRNIITVLNSVKHTELFLLFKEETEKRITELEKQLSAYLKLLTESPHVGKESSKAWFPVIETGGGENEFPLGFTEYVTVELKTSKTQDEIFIMPGGVKAGEELHRQVLHSLGLAYEILYPGRVRKNHFSVWLLFHEQHGSYTGTSLGISLSLALLEALSVYNNNTHLFKLKPGIAFTGSVDQEGGINALPSGIVAAKTEVCFYSGLRSLIVPEENLIEARNALSVLKEKYPAKQFKVMGSGNLSELINRRDIINIHKQSLPLRGVKAVAKHRYHSIIILITAVILLIISLYDFDTNPVGLSVNAGILSVINKYGKVLWNKRVDYDTDKLMRTQKIYDIDGDGINEVFLTDETVVEKDSAQDYPRIACYNFRGEMLWKFSFYDTISTDKEVIPNTYSRPTIIDTVRVNGRLKILLFTNSLYSFPGVIYRIDLLTGKEENVRFYHPGHILHALITNSHDKGGHNLVFSAINNSTEMVSLAVVPLENNLGQVVALGNNHYRLLGINPLKMDNYILFPKTDYLEALQIRTNNVQMMDISRIPHFTRINFAVMEGDIGTTVGYHFSLDFSRCDLDVSNNLRVRRDSLVAQGKLSHPYTDTPEYAQVLKQKLLKWDGEKFVKLFP